jgi:exodeoxyribonuclease-3
MLHDGERWLSVRIGSLDLNALCIHIPDATTGKYDADGHGISGKRRKENFWDAVVTYSQSHKGEKTILLGDLNTGFKEDAQGTPFVLSERMGVLRLEKYADAWRLLNPTAKREYTWYSKQKGEDYNGFRLDYVFVSAALRASVTHAEHVHHVRVGKLSDHAMVMADVSV